MGKQSTIENGLTWEAIVTKGDNLTVKKCDGLGQGKGENIVGQIDKNTVHGWFG